MFEAHTLSESDLTTTVISEKPVVEGKTYNCWHSGYQCNVRYWFAAGKRQGKQHHFLFIEYKNRDNSHGYSKVELTDHPLTQKKIRDLIHTVTLPETLDPIKTEHWCNR